MVEGHQVSSCQNSGNTLLEDIYLQNWVSRLEETLAQQWYFIHIHTHVDLKVAVTHNERHLLIFLHMAILYQ